MTIRFEKLIKLNNFNYYAGMVVIISNTFNYHVGNHFLAYILMSLFATLLVYTEYKGRVREQLQLEDSLNIIRSFELLINEYREQSTNFEILKTELKKQQTAKDL